MSLFILFVLQSSVRLWRYFVSKYVRDSPKSRNFCLRLYPDDPSHVQCINLLSTSGYQYCSILHDRDIWLADDPKLADHTPGDPKKPHYHVLVCFKSPRYLDPVASELGIESRHIECCSSRDSFLLYMLHRGYDDKFQYDFTDMTGPLAVKYEKMLSGEDEGSRVKQIVHIIDDCPGKMSYRSLLLKVCDSGLYGEFRRLGAGAKYLLDEHNEAFDISTFAEERSRLDNEEFRLYQKYFRGGG